MRRFPYSLSRLLLTVAFISLFFAFRRFFVFGGNLFADCIDRAALLPSFFALLAAVAFEFTRHGRSLWPSVAISAAAAFAVVTPLAIELAEIARINWNYWNWRHDFPEFILILSKHSLLGAIAGGLVAISFRWARKARQNLMSRSV